jgi:hypothetical protein
MTSTRGVAKYKKDKEMAKPGLEVQDRAASVSGDCDGGFERPPLKQGDLARLRAFSKSSQESQNRLSGPRMKCEATNCLARSGLLQGQRLKWCSGIEWFLEQHHLLVAKMRNLTGRSRPASWRALRRQDAAAI